MRPFADARNGQIHPKEGNNVEQFQKEWEKIVVQAWADASFKQRLLSDPAGVLKERGIDVHDEITLKVMEDSAQMVHLILPERPAELSDAELSQVAGGVDPIPLPKVMSWFRMISYR
jgi:hypothetical protein